MNINKKEVNLIGTIKTIYSLLVLREKKLFFVFVILSILSLFFEALGIALFIPLISLITNSVEIENNVLKYFYSLFISENEEFTFLYLILFFIFAFLAKNIVLIAINYWQLRYGELIRRRISNEMFKKYVDQNINFFFNKDKSIIIKYIQSETNHIKETVNYLGNIFSEILILLLLVITLISFSNSYIFIIILTFGIFAFLFDKITKKKIKKLGEVRFNSSNKFVKILMDGFKSIRDLKLYNKSFFYFENFKKYNADFGNASTNFGFFNNLSRPFFEIIAILSFLLFCLISFKTGNSVSDIVGQLSILFLITIRLMPSITKISTGFSGMRYVSSGLNEMKLEFENLEKNIFLNNQGKKYQVNDFKRNIKLKNVNFSYPNKKEIFNNLNVEIEKGDRIAIVGKSGSGKSTFLDILVGFFSPQSGNFIIDDKQYLFNEVYRMNLFGYVYQNINILNDTILKNLTYSNNINLIDMEKIYRACQEAQILDFIESLPKKFETIIGEDGSKISGGQKQRLGIARALISSPKILILDEATNALDKKTENEFFHVIKNIDKDLSILSVSHKSLDYNFFNKKLVIEGKNLTFEKL
jgi:ABC-type multidrug transport system fused ATPase/permease subunit